MPSEHGKVCLDRPMSDPDSQEKGEAYRKKITPRMAGGLEADPSHMRGARG